MYIAHIFLILPSLPVAVREFHELTLVTFKGPGKCAEEQMLGLGLRDCFAEK